MPQGANSPQQGQTGNPYQVTENRFWNFVPATGTKPPEMLLYGPIASQKSWWEDRVTPAQFNQELAAIGDVEELVVRINSPGGDVFAAHAIYCRLRDIDAKITVKIDGWAASAATIVAMAGDVIQIPRNGVFMIHDPAMTVWDTYKAADFEKLAQELKVIKQSIVNTYAGRTKMKDEDIAAMMQEETWWTGDQAVEKGFCDSIMFEAEPQTHRRSARLDPVHAGIGGILCNRRQVLCARLLLGGNDLQGHLPSVHGGFEQGIFHDAFIPRRGRVHDALDPLPLAVHGFRADLVHQIRVFWTMARASLTGPLRKFCKEKGGNESGRVDRAAGVHAEKVLCRGRPPASVRQRSSRPPAQRPRGF